MRRAVLVAVLARGALAATAAGQSRTNETYGLVFPKGSPLRPMLDQGLASLKQAGTIVTLEKRWLGGDIAKLPQLR